MKKAKAKEFESFSLGKRLKTMTSVDFGRMFTTPFFYIMFGISFLIPILVIVMTTMMDGTTSVNPQTGVETTMEAFKNTWQVIGTISGGSSAMAMDLTSMVNINLVYFIVSVLVCLFVAADFRSGYAKNLFTIRAKKTDYMISKTLVCFVAGAFMLLAFFIGTMLGGLIMGLPFDLGEASVGSIVLCMICKVLLMAVFVPIYLLMSVIAKQKSWLSILLSLMTGMFLFMMIPMLTPLNATIMNVILCLAGGAMFSVGLGAIGNSILKKKDIL